VLVRTHAQTELIAEALRESGIPHRVRGGTAFLERPVVRAALRDLRSSRSPLGTALADLELSLDADPGPLDHSLADDDDLEAKALLLAQRDEEHAAMALLLRMGRDYLRLDPVGGAGSFSSWLAATVRSEGEAAGTSTDAVDVATFHAAKGLEWVIVHLAGVEDGYVPIAHAKTAAARAEEARLLYVAMTRAQRELRISWAEQRTFSAKVVDRRRSPLLSPVPDRASVTPAHSAAAPTPPVPDWSEELARQREVLRLGQRDRTPPELEALRSWRDRVARAARVEADAVLPDHVLARIAETRPRDLTELGAIRGVGAILADRFGDDVLAALNDPTARSAS
jgi:DNA helicase-2/ATP-dependent DNA helicase PcrA